MMAQIKISTPLMISKKRFIRKRINPNLKICREARKLIGMQTKEAKKVPKNAMPSVCASPVKIELKFQLKKSLQVNIANKIGFIFERPENIFPKVKSK